MARAIAWDKDRYFGRQACKVKKYETVLRQPNLQ
jgi:hypothetical protein